jgi:predicted kinase
MQSARLTLLLMAGLPGAGKTTLAGYLGCDLGWQVIDKDGRKQELMNQGVDDDTSGRRAYDLSFAEARETLSIKRTSVILDSAALHKFILASARDIVSNVEDSRLKVILCVADRDLRNERLRKRPAQITAIRVDPASIIDYLQYFEHLPSDKLTLFTHIPVEECYAKAIEYLKT